MSSFYEHHKIGFQPQYDSPSASKTKDRQQQRNAMSLLKRFPKGGFSSHHTLSPQLQGLREVCRQGDWVFPVGHILLSKPSHWPSCSVLFEILGFQVEF